MDSYVMNPYSIRFPADGPTLAQFFGVYLVISEVGSPDYMMKSAIFEI